MNRIFKILPSVITDRFTAIHKENKTFTILYYNSDGHISQCVGELEDCINHLRTEFKSVKCKQEELCDIAINIVSAEYELSYETIISGSRKREIVEARQVAMTLVKNRFKDKNIISMAKIGSYIGSKDHATVLHAGRTVNNLYDSNKKFHKMFETLTNTYDEITKYE